MLPHAIASREVGGAERTLDPEPRDVDGQMFPRRVPIVLGYPAFIHSTNLPVAAACWPVNLKYMVFPRAFHWPSGVVDNVTEIASFERAGKQVLQPFFFSTLGCAGIVLDGVDHT